MYLKSKVDFKITYTPKKVSLEYIQSSASKKFITLSLDKHASDEQKRIVRPKN